MNGAQSPAKSLVASGIDTCFADPGTSEMHFVGALDSAPKSGSGAGGLPEAAPGPHEILNPGQNPWPFRERSPEP